MIDKMVKYRISVNTKSFLLTFFSPILVVALWVGILLNNRTITVWFYKKDKPLFNLVLKKWRNVPMWAVEEFKPWRVISRRQVLESKHITMEVFEKLLPIDEAYHSLKGASLYKRNPHLLASSWKKNPILLTPEFACATYVLNRIAFKTCPVDKLPDSVQQTIAENIVFKNSVGEDTSNIGYKLSSPEALTILYRRAYEFSNFTNTSIKIIIARVIENLYTPDSVVEEYLNKRINNDHYFVTSALIRRGNTKVLSEQMWNHLITSPETEEVISDMLARKDNLTIFPTELFLAVYASKRLKGEKSYLEERIIKTTGLTNWNDTVNFWLAQKDGYEIEDVNQMLLAWKEELLIQEYGVVSPVPTEKAGD